MASKFEFDETRNAIGADKLENSERKAMLDKFKSAGGKVLSEKELKEKKKQENLQKLGGKPSSSSRGRYGGFDEESSNSQQNDEKKQNNNSGSLTRFILKLKTFFDGITPFSSDAIKTSFIKYLGLDVKQAIVEFNLIGNDLFLLNRDIGKKIANSLDQRNPILIELIQKLHSLFDAKLFNRLLEFHQSNPNSMIPFSIIEEPVRSLFKKLYYIYPYQETIKKALNIAVDIYLKESNDQNNNNLMDQKKKKFLKDINEVFLKAFPKLFLLICRMDGVEYIPFSSALEKALSIDQNEKIGNRKKGESTTLAVNFHDIDSENETDNNVDGEEGSVDEEGTPEEKEENKNTEKAAAITTTKEYQYGIKLMRQNPLPVLRQKHDSHKKFIHIQYNDRAFLAYLFFLEFDRELSFVLTTKKIKLAADYSTGTKKDYKQILADAFNQSRTIIQAFENYAEARKNYQIYEKPQNIGANHVEAAKRKDQARSKMDIEGRNVRGLVRSYMDNVTKILATLITDMKTNKAIVENMDEALEFDSDLEGSKRLNGQPVKQCILETYCYSLALNERLINGDLFGGILDMTDEEMITNFGSTFKDSPA
ncbi:MAG: hypothetical protein OEV78_09905 [Spirochaetia bacterium]|nr:hypothetical protein [Spirochaetia bacterium]